MISKFFHFNTPIYSQLQLSQQQIPSQLPSDPCISNTKFVFPIEYENLWKKNYIINEHDEGLEAIDKDSVDRAKKATSWLIKKISSKIFKGQSVMNISLPVFIFDKRTMLQVFVTELRTAPYFLSRAYHTPIPVERIKWVTTFFFSQLYHSPFQSKPFNPIIGETFQTKLGDMNIYLEQTANKPPTANVYCFDDNKTYKLYGHVATTASTGANSCKAYKHGKMILEFKDGTKYSLYYPTVWVGGIIVSKCMFNYKHTMLVIDESNELASLIEFKTGEKKKKGFLGKVFGGSSKKDNKDVSGLPDRVEGYICSSKDITIDAKGNKHSLNKKAVTYGEISGSWIHHLRVDGEMLWKREDYQIYQTYEMGFKLPSDSTFRKDLEMFIKGNENEAQALKEQYEEDQRRDRKLREEYEKKKSKHH